MQKPRQVPGIAQSRPNISRGTLPPIASPMMLGQQAMQQAQPQAEDAIAESVQDLALEIYAQLAVKHIQHNQETDRETLGALARSAQTAALAYFETMGVQFDAT